MSFYPLMLTFLALFNSLFAIDESLYQTTDITQRRAHAVQGIAPICSLKEISQELEKMGSDSLIVLDVDEVLITSKDLFFHPIAEPFVLGLVKKEMREAKSDEERKSIEEKLSTSLLETQRYLLEEDSPALLKRLLNKGCKVVALTSFPTGRFGKVAEVEKWRIDHLKSLGLDFSSFFPKTGRKEFSFIAKPSIAAPLFQEGILFSRGYAKGDVLVAFLNWIQFKPSKIVFIDDILENHDNMRVVLAANNLCLRSFHYQFNNIPLDDANKEIIEFQFNNLIKNNQWLGDEEAQKMKFSICKP
jgi:hypothetical protein